MKRDKILFGSVEDGGATGVVPFSHGRPRPPREHAASPIVQNDGPYNYFSIAGYRSVSATCLVTGGATVAATLHLQVTNDDPSDANAYWATVDSSSSLGEDGTDHLVANDIAARFARVSWTSGANDPHINVTAYAN